MLIADAQVHIWAPETPERPWAARYPAHREPPFQMADLLREMNAAGVQRSVIVPPSWEGDRNDLALEAARLYPDRCAVMGRLDIDAADASAQIARWRDQAGMLGIRFTFVRPLLWAPLVEGRVDWVWGAAEKAGVPLMVSLPHAMLHLIDRIAERHPGLKLIIDHLGIPYGKRGDEAFAELDKLLALAKRPNVAVKATCMPLYSGDAYPHRCVHPHLRRVYDGFGRQRMFWGSDITRLPVSPTSYRQVIDLFAKEIAWLTDLDKEWIMGRGLCAWLGWPLPPV